MPPCKSPLPLCFAFLLAGAALSARANESGFRQQFLADEHLKQNILTTAARSIVMTHHACTAATYEAADPVELETMKFSDIGSPLSGELRFPVHEEGCGASHELNVYLWVEHESSIAITPMLPGSSHAGDSLQKSAYAYALQAAGGPDHNCPATYVENTQFVGEQSGKAAQGAPWKELWTLSSCSWRAEVPVTFTPDPHGTKITAGPKSAVKKSLPDMGKM